LLTKSIPYNDFCALLASYAKNEAPGLDTIKLATTLPLSGSHICDPNKPCRALADARNLNDVAMQAHAWLSLGLCVAFMAICAAIVVFIRRRNQAIRSSIKSVLLVLTASLLAGAALGGSYSLAYVASGPVWNLDDTNDPNSISSGKVVWKQSVQGSKTNANCFVDLQSSFDKWSSIPNCRIGFSNAGTTSNTHHSASDGVSFVVWDQNPDGDFSSATLAITYTSYTLGTVMNFNDCDIVFNDRDFSWAPGGRGNTKSVSLHEIGHFIGLAHTSNNACVMYPIDNGYLQLSPDEVLAAQKLYPGTGSVIPQAIPPIASITGSPLSGISPLNCGFDASASAPGTGTITSYVWNFGDGSSGNGATMSHTYTTAGVYSATVTTTNSSGSSSTATVTVHVAGAANAIKGAFKLQFNTTGKDSFSAVLQSDSLMNYAQSGVGVVNGTATVAGAVFPFAYDLANGKATGSNGLKLVINAKSGAVTIALKNASLQSALGALGAANLNLTGQTVPVPVRLVFGDNADLTLDTLIPFTYTSLKNKSGQGKYP